MTYPWERQAKQNAPMPAGLKASEQRAYQTLALLTARYRAGYISADAAQRERKEIDRQYIIDAADEVLNDWHVRLRKGIELAHARYRKERTIEAADLLSDVLDGFVRV